MPEISTAAFQAKTDNVDSNVCQGPLCAPRDDLLTEAQAKALHAELLAGHEQPEGIPKWALDKLDLADTGCGTSFGNRREIFEHTYMCKSDVNGASGAFVTNEKGTMRNPLMDTHGNLGIYREHDAILHEACAYTLIAVGRASREQGMSLWMPPHGTDGYTCSSPPEYASPCSTGKCWL